MKTTNKLPSMSTPKDTGGAAFPKPAEVGHYAQPGMTLRDYFAAEALGALVGDETFMAALARVSSAEAIGPEETFPLIAQRAYAYADAMVKEKRRTEGEE